MMDDEDVRQCFCLSLRRSARQITQFYDKRLRSSGLRTTQFQLLAAISKIGPTAQQPLADLMGMDRTTLTRNLSLLVKQSFVLVKTSCSDRREREIGLTPSGKNILGKAMPLWKDAQSAMKQRVAAHPAAAHFPDLLGVMAQIYSAGQ